MDLFKCTQKTASLFDKYKVIVGQNLIDKVVRYGGFKNKPDGVFLSVTVFIMLCNRISSRRNFSLSCHFSTRSETGRSMWSLSLSRTTRVRDEIYHLLCMERTILFYVGTPTSVYLPDFFSASPILEESYFFYGGS